MAFFEYHSGNEALACGVWDSGFRLGGLGFRVKGSRFWDLGFKVLGLGI